MIEYYINGVLELIVLFERPFIVVELYNTIFILILLKNIIFIWA